MKLSHSLLILVTLFISCSESTNVTTFKKFKTGSPIKAASGDQLIIKSDSSDLMITVLSVSDFRCPQDVVCMWQGDVEVQFMVGDQKKLISLCLLQSSANCKNETEETVNEKIYTIKLLNVSPYPTSTKVNEEKIVEFQVN